MRPAPRRKKTISILIVEDDPFSRSFASEALKTMREYNIQRHLVGSYNEALVTFKTAKPQIALVDIGLPDGNGFMLLENFQKTDPDCHVAMLTASRVEADVKRALEMGAVDYIVKPFTTRRIQKVIKTYLQHKKTAGSAT